MRTLSIALVLSLTLGGQAFAADVQGKVSDRTGGVLGAAVVRLLSIATGETRQITFGEGSNESPAWAPNGRHLAFMSTRAGRAQIFTVDRDGRNLRQLTKEGNNTYPNWSQ